MMNRMDQLLDLLDRWDETEPARRGKPEEFCKDQNDLMDDFVSVLRQRGVISALLNADSCSVIEPESMIEKMQTGRFPVVQFHDKGGLGWVYLAKDQELGRTVALKCLQPVPATDPLARERFIREAEITAKLEHPGIVPIYGLGGIPLQEFPYYTMRFIQGETLRNAISTLHSTANSPDWRGLQAIRMLRSFVTVCDTIAFAHSKSVIHRDLKSSNIMLGAYGETLVLDWGLARVLNGSSELQVTPSSQTDEANEVDQVTKAGAILGTVGFMSPEQALSDWSRVGPATDIFSLGAILYQILTNQVAYHGERALVNAQSCSFPSPAHVKPAVPLSLAAICLKAMEPDPSHRYASAIDLKHDIELFLADEPISVRQDSIVERIGRWMRKHRGVVALSGWMSLATILMLTVFLCLTAEKNRELEESTHRERHAKNEAVYHKDRANAELRQTIHENYVASMAQLSHALTDRHPTRHTNTLLHSQPRIGSPIDPRGIEWWMNWWIAYGSAQVLPYGNVLSATLIDQGRKSAIWTTENELRVIDHASGKTQFVTKIRGFLIRRPGDFPISSDGSTIAIPDGPSLQVYRANGSTYDLLAELELNRQEENGLERVMLSHRGNVLAIAGIDGSVHGWDLTSLNPLGTLDSLGRVEGLKLSSDGRFIAYYQDERPTLFELATGVKRIFEEFDRGEFHGLAFGQFGTLVIWSNKLAVTLDIDHPEHLVKLWQTPLPCPPALADSRTIRIEREVLEWIVLDKDSQRMPDPRLSGKWNSGSQPAEVIATILVTFSSNGTQMFYREPGGTYPWERPSYDTSNPPDRITEFKSPCIKEIVDVTSDGERFLIRRGQFEHLSVPRSKILLERLDYGSHRGELNRLAWTSKNGLIALSKGATSLSRREPGSQVFHFPETYRVLPPDSASNHSEGRIMGSQATISSDGRIVACFGDQVLQVWDSLHNSEEYHFRWNQPESLFDNGTINMFVWNRYDRQQLNGQADEEDDFEMVIRGLRHEIDKKIDLPWILVFQNERSRDITRVTERVTTKLYIIDYQKSAVVHTIEIPFAYVESVAIRPDGREFAIASNDHIVRAWNILDDLTINKAWEQTLPTNVSCMAYRESRSCVVAGNIDGDVYLIGQGKVCEEFIPKAHENAITAVAFSANGNRLITAGADNTVRMFDTTGRNEVFQLSMPQPPTCVALSHDESSLAIGDAAGHVVVVPRASIQEVWRFAKDKSRIPEWADRAEDLVLREIWAEYVGSNGRSDEEIDLAISAIESMRGKLIGVDRIDQLRQIFFQAFPPGH